MIYDAQAKLLIRSWKERGVRGLSSVAADVVAGTVARPDVDAIAFVPPDGDRSLVRGHHPAAALAVALGRRWELPAISRAAAHEGGGTPGGAPARGDGGRTSAAPSPRRTTSRRSICLVDDVYTSGGTAHAAASALRKGGARTVSVVTFARAVR